MSIVGFTCGSYDLLHAGHILALAQAWAHCDRLVVGLQEDPSLDRPHKNAPIQSVEERRIQLEAVRYVDEVVTYRREADLVELLRRIQPDVRILGADWKGKRFTGDRLPIQCVFTARDHPWSSSELRRRVAEAEQQAAELERAAS